MMTELTLQQANTIISGVLATARELGLPPLGVAVLDAGGHLKALQREDGLSFLRVQICQAKAWGALALGVNSRAIADRYVLDLHQQGFIDGLNALSAGRVVPLPGGVLIRDGSGTITGAVGVAGGPSDQDEICAMAGIHGAGLHAEAPADPG